MFAVIKSGGKQYKVSSGDELRVEKLSGKKEPKEGDTITFDKVLLIDDGKTTKVGDPFIKDAKIEAKFMRQGRGKKIVIQKFKSKSRYHKRIGHRQPYSQVKITSVK